MDHEQLRWLASVLGTIEDGYMDVVEAAIDAARRDLVAELHQGTPLTLHRVLEAVGTHMKGVML